MIDILGGTAERTWRRWGGLHALPPLELSFTRAVIVAPHPDDEVLALGGTVQRLARAGCAITFVAVTDGEASHPGSTAITRRGLAGRRRTEAAQARRILGVEAARVEHLAIPDGAVEAHGDAVAAAVARLADERTTVLAPWRDDGHPDHEAAGLASARGAAQVGARLIEYPVWMWNWADPADGRVPWARAHAVSLSRDAQLRKASAVLAFRTQIEALGPEAADGPILPATILDHHLRPFEVVFS